MKRFLLALVLMFCLLPAIPAQAYLVAPDSVTISNVMAYRNLAEDGDSLIIFHYSMPYAGDNYSSTPASKTIIFRLINSTNGTVYQTRAPFVNPYFETNGYGEGDGCFYFADADTNKPAWGEAATIQIVETPAYFSPAYTQSYVMVASDYYSGTTQDSNREALASYILLECDEFTTDYDIVLKTSSDVGIILSQYGELYFKGVIDEGLQSLVPSLFFIQSAVPEAMTITSYNMTTSDTYSHRLDTDDLGKGFTRLPTLFHMGKEAFWGIFCFGFTIAACIWTAKKSWGAELGIVVGFLVTLCIALLAGGAVFTGVMIFSFLAAIGIVWIFILKRA